MSSRARTFVVGLVALTLFTVTATLLSQTSSGQAGASASRQAAATVITLNGLVQDKDGVLPGATVTLQRIATGEVLPPQITNTSGAYSFRGLAPGAYKITVTMAGFKTNVVQMRLDEGGTYALTSKLEIGAREEVVTVIGKSDIVRTPTPTVSQTVGADQIQRLPRADRDALNFLVFLPGVQAVDQAGGRGGAARSSTIAGLPQSATNITIDGVTQSNLLQSGDGFYSRVVPRLDAVEEVTLRTGETYSQFRPNPFRSTFEHPLSTFGADVDTASYSNIRRFLSNGQLPPREAVRLEELVNYFRFAYAQPRGTAPIALTTEIGECPWAPGHKLVLVGARAAAPVTRDITGRNLVLLIDVSGSMQPTERLPLIKTALGLFVDTLKPDDSIAIVTYAGSSGIALQPTRARQRATIQQAIANLQAGGSTNGGDGLQLAYRLARAAFMRGGVNRVILATDGDFNVGITSQQELLQLIEHERESGVFLSVLGVGSGNLKDRTMEMLADRGNGNYSYLDSLQEARRVLIKEGDATIEAVAKDVKFQVEFNPAIVSAWKLLGYENRALAAQDFNNDRKDAGEMGAGHTVTALYEVIPVGVNRPVEDLELDRPAVDPLRYQPQPAVAMSAAPVAGRGRRGGGPAAATTNGEWLTVKARFKQPEGDVSELITLPVRAGGRVQYLPLASAVAEFGILLRDAPKNDERWGALEQRVDALTPPAALAAEVEGFKQLVATARGLARLR